MKTTVYIAASLDGFIARPDGGLDFLESGGPAPAGEDYGYQAFMDSVDALVMGRHTYEKVLTFDLDVWPYEKPVYVLTSRPEALPGPARPDVHAITGAPADIVAALGSKGITHAYVDGGLTVQRFLEAGLVDRLILTRIPVLIGSGIPLFGPLSGDIRLEHVATRSFSSGLVQSEYRVRKSAA